MRWLLILVGLCFLEVRGQPGDSAWISEIRQYREHLDEEFRDSLTSPLSPEERKQFRALDFFPADSRYRVTATVRLTPGDKPFRMKTTTSREPEYVRYAVLTFTVEGETYSLETYRNLAFLRKPGYEDYLFLPFRDSTNGFETYGGGRYLDLPTPTGDTILLDFNKAYNPYCAYSDEYSCPIPPEVNFLPSKIKAGVLAPRNH